MVQIAQFEGNVKHFPSNIPFNLIYHFLLNQINLPDVYNLSPTRVQGPIQENTTVSQATQRDR